MAEDPEDTKEMGGFPEDGDEYVENASGTGPDPKETGEGDPEKGQQPPPAAQETPEERIARLEGLIRGLETRLGTQQQPQPPKKVEKPKRDWEKLLFEDTESAINLLRQDIRDEIVAEVRTDYQKDQGEREFWQQFYKTNKDLEGDDFLVQATMSKNLPQLLDLPVSEAIKKLGDLTREQIMRYTGKKPNGGKKATVEGGGKSSSAPPKKEEPTAPASLGDLIRARRANRMKKAQTA